MFEVRRIAILRALKLGDLLCTVPALRALRAAHPFAEIRLIGLPWAAEFVRRFDRYLDGLFVLPGFPGFPEQPFDARAFTRFLDDVHQWTPDRVLQMHGSGDLSNPLSMLLGGEATAGYFLPGSYCPDPARFIPYPDALPEVERHLRLLEHLGITRHGSYKELPVYDTDRRALAEVVPDRALDRPYIVVHPGASVPERRWPPERFAAVADELARMGLGIVLTGSDAEASVTAAVRQELVTPALDLTARTTLGSLAALLEGANLVISNDTGVMHVAESVGTSLVAVSFDPEAWRWAPEDTGRFRMLPGGVTVRTRDVLDVARALLCTRTGLRWAAHSSAGQTPEASHCRTEGG
ncbi:MAG: glycosyltransferase family 9 protein [Chloroflexota bacterium]